MPETDTQLIDKITSHEADFTYIYALIHPALKRGDRSKLSAEEITDLDSLDAPETIQPAKAAAILKAIMGSTSEDKLKLESCYSFKMPDGKLLGTFVEEQLHQLGIKYHEFWPYLRKHGMLKNDSQSAQSRASA